MAVLSLVEPDNDLGGSTVYISHEKDLLIFLGIVALIDTNRIDPDQSWLYDGTQGSKSAVGVGGHLASGALRLD